MADPAGGVLQGEDREERQQSRRDPRQQATLKLKKHQRLTVRSCDGKCTDALIGTLLKRTDNEVRNNATAGEASAWW